MAVDSQQMTERRAYRRSVVCLPLQLYNGKAKAMLAAGNTVNISPAGLLAELGNGGAGRLQEEQVVRVHIGPPAEDWPQIDSFFDGTVRRLFGGTSRRCAIEVIGEPPDFLFAPEMVGTHPAIMRLKKTLLKIAAYDVSVLVRGESGTGKNVAAAIVHAHSTRAARPFVRINCPSIPELLLESQMFGHDRGAFTDAKESRPGLFRLANGGAVVLDEISAVPMSTQAKLLQAIEEKRFLPLGGKEMVKVDVRVIATTNDNLERRMREGTFREDLFFRLNEMVVVLPPLRDRASDVAILAEHFFQKYCRQFAKAYHPLEKETVEQLMRHSWPGNVRELENTIKRGVIVGDFETSSSTEPVDPPVQPGPLKRPPPEDHAVGDPPTLKDARKAAEKERIIQALAQAGYDRTRAAALLGISYRTLLRRMKEFGIQL
jgi:transcriptional regulator with PAS, ATPase and Fis domain